MRIRHCCLLTTDALSTTTSGMPCWRNSTGGCHPVAVDGGLSHLCRSSHQLSCSACTATLRSAGAGVVPSAAAGAARFGESIFRIVFSPIIELGNASPLIGRHTKTTLVAVQLDLCFWGEGSSTAEGNKNDVSRLQPPSDVERNRISSSG